jgi:hypothetical protein
MGECPSWYPLLQASRYLKVPPWDLARQPIWWMRIALAAMSAEARESRRAQEQRGG